MKMYETYGFGTKVNPELIEIDLKCGCGGSLNKPDKAWWGSPVNAEYGWKEYCIGEEWIPRKFHKSMSIEEYFSDSNKCTWSLKSSSNILSIEDLGDIYFMRDHDYFKKYDDRYRDIYTLDYELLRELGYIAVELLNPYIGHMFTDPYEMSFNSWDCESIVVLEPKNIIWN